VNILKGGVINKGTEYLAGLNTEPALFPEGSSPLYSNAGVTLLGLVIQNILGSDPETLFNESIVAALGLKSTSFVAPNTTASAVIPGNATTSGWNSVFGILGP
jgi:CubicO group peptidase (beta-lactamase class C family)